MRRRDSSSVTPKVEEIISRVPGVCGGDPTIKGSRISVTDVVDYARIVAQENGFLDKDSTAPPPRDLLTEGPRRTSIVEQLVEYWPHITAAQITGAWQYYLDHYDEVLQLLAQEDAANKRAAEQYGRVS